MLIDIKRCVGCGLCMEACMQAHGQTGAIDEIKDLSAGAYTVVVEKEDQYVRKLCMHCLHPTCVSACPVAALQKSADGPVVYDASRCIGCRYCIQACPFNVPRYEWDRPVPGIAKCDFCVARQARGEIPACAAACPESATVFGTREEMLAEAHRRIDEDPEGYYPQVYGEHEVGGTSILFISPVSFERMGFPNGLPLEALPLRTWAALSHVPDVIWVGSAALLAIWWITQRRQEVARVEAVEAAAAPALRRGGDKA
jgi:formate dehydrogenase iron-sulfur subunit